MLSYDLFPSGGTLRLNSWKFGASSAPAAGVVAANGVGKKSAAARVTTTATFTHADVRKLASMGLGNLDFSTRASALGQLLYMLSSDAHLLHTVDIDWVAATVRVSLEQLGSVAPFLGEDTLKCSPERLQSMTDAECRLFVETGIIHTRTVAAVTGLLQLVHGQQQLEQHTHMQV